MREYVILCCTVLYSSILYYCILFVLWFVSRFIYSEIVQEITTTAGTDNWTGNHFNSTVTLIKTCHYGR